MANIKSQIKRNRQNELARERNKSVRSALKTAVRRFEEAIASGNNDDAKKLAGVVAAALDERHAHGLALDRDAALALDVHADEVLRLHVATVDDTGVLQHAVGQRRLAVIDVRDDAEVAQDLRVGGPGLGYGAGAHDEPFSHHRGADRAARRPIAPI